MEFKVVKMVTIFKDEVSCSLVDFHQHLEKECMPLLASC
jgi:hypothetical protein